MFRRIAKKAGQRVWRMSSFLRRPLRARFDARVEQVVANTVNARMLPALLESMSLSDQRLERIERALGSANHAASSIAEEMDLVLGGMSREVFRLQAQIEDLRSVIEADHATRFSIVDDDAADDDRMCRPISQDRARVG